METNNRAAKRRSIENINMNELTVIESNQLDKCEEIIEQGLQTFVDVGRALQIVKEGKLYRTKFRTFEEYCEHRWQVTKLHAYRLINAAQTVSILEENPGIEVLPQKERQVRPLNKLHKDERAEAWQQALDETDGKPTSRDVQSVVDRRKPTIGVDGPADWYTPASYVELAKKTMGSIDLDPASCAAANKTVGATTYYSVSEGRDGLREPWLGNVYLNPPYGRKVIQSWIEKAIDEYEKGNAEQIVICINNATDTAWFHELWHYSLCFVKGRIKFYGPHNKTDSPAHGTVFAYLGDNVNLFGELFSEVGAVLGWHDELTRSIFLK